MEQFKRYILSSKLKDEKKAGYYLTWVTRFYNFYKKKPKDAITSEEIEHYLQSLSKNCEDWQIMQAAEAIQLFQLYKGQKENSQKRDNQPISAQWKLIADTMQKVLRLMHRSYRTEQAYIGWLRQLYRFTKERSPYSIESRDVKDFMTHLAVKQNVSISTQNQAFNAILFLFRYVLDKKIDDISDAVRAKRTRRLPVVLTKSEIKKLFDQMSGLYLLMAKVLYGSGLRLRECIQLRIKDIDFERNVVTVRSGKGDKDRETTLPESIKGDLREQLKKAQKYYENDRKSNIAGVQLPYAFERKSPNAGKEWVWFWAFPSYKLSVDPITKIVRRHHIHHGNLNKHIRQAGLKAKIPKRITVHTLRHYADFRIMPTLF